MHAISSAIGYGAMSIDNNPYSTFRNFMDPGNKRNSSLIMNDVLKEKNF